MNKKPRFRLSSLPRAARILSAALVLSMAVFGFASAGSFAEASLRVLSSWQLFPLLSGSLRTLLEAFPGAISASLAVSMALAALILIFSAVFGRWYCAALCPLGTLQDIAIWLGRGKLRYRRAATAARACSAIAAVSLVLAGAVGIASWLDPWSLFSRFMTNDVQPIARLAARLDIPGLSPSAVAVPALALSAILILAALYGRWFCGTLCPVGTVLGIFNRTAPFRMRLDRSDCVSCGACASRCPTSCIDTEARNIDLSRCVNCLECLGACPSNALRYGYKKHTIIAAEGHAMSRSRFLAALGGGAAALAFSALPGRALAARIAAPGSATTPPGSVSLKRFLETCTACGLCAAKCPSKVLQPSLGQLGLRGLFVPRLDYSVSYCQFECTTCLDLCPSGALERLTKDRKKLTKIGNAALIRKLCIVITNKTKCGACAEHCPTGAVRMVEVPTGIPEPVFSSDICIGCGACHHICPVLPEKAITVTGLAIHSMAVRPSLELFAAPASRETGAESGSGEFPF